MGRGWARRRRPPGLRHSSTGTRAPRTRLGTARPGGGGGGGRAGRGRHARGGGGGGGRPGGSGPARPGTGSRGTRSPTCPRTAPGPAAGWPGRAAAPGRRPGSAAAAGTPSGPRPAAGSPAPSGPTPRPWRTPVRPGAAAPPGRAAPPGGRRPGRARGRSPGPPRPPGRPRPSRAGSPAEHSAGVVRARGRCTPPATPVRFVVFAGSGWQDTNQPGREPGEGGPGPERVLLISSASFLGAGLESLAPGRLQVARLDPAPRPVAWPAEPAATVVLDVTARQLEAFHLSVRRHHTGPLVVVLKPGERRPALPPDPDLVVLGPPC